MKLTRTPRPLGGRMLSLGARGERVRRLQLQLHELGYDPGPADGLYGHLTFAAVRELQRDFRLQADGTAGRRVLAALSDERLTNVRERIVIAELHAHVSDGMAARAVQRHVASLSGVAVPTTAIADDEADSAPAETAEVSTVNGKTAPPVLLSSHDPVAVARKQQLSVWTTLHTRTDAGAGHYEQGRLQRLLHNRAARDKLERQARQLLAADIDGALYFDLGQIVWGDGGRLLTLVRHISRAAARSGRELVVSVPLRIGVRGWDRLFKELDRSALASVAARIVLVPPVSVSAAKPRRIFGSRAGEGDGVEHAAELVAGSGQAAPRRSGQRRRRGSAGPGGHDVGNGRTHSPARSAYSAAPQRPPSPQQLSAAIREIVRDVPPWRCLLMVPLGAVVISADGNRAPAVLTYQQALALAYNSRTRPQWDETVRRPGFRCMYQGEPATVWLENRFSIGHKLDVVDRWRLAGVYLSAVGLEDARVWGALRERWQVYRYPAR